MNLSLRELLDRCKNAESDAIAELIRRFQPWALDFATGILDDRDLAEDAVQDAFLTAITRLNDLRELEAFPGWMRQIIRTCAMRIMRSRRELPLDCEIGTATNAPIESLELEELRAQVRQAIQALSPSRRETTELFYFNELSCNEISDLLRVPKGTVRRRLHDAREQLRGMLVGYIGNFPASEMEYRKTRRAAGAIPDEMTCEMRRETTMSATIPSTLENLLRDAVARRASDIHLIPDEPPALRIDGVLQRLEREPMTATDIREIAASMIDSDDLEKIGREFGEVHRSINLEGEINARMYVARAYGEYTIAISMGVTTIPMPEDLQVPEAVLNALGSPTGLIVISGVVGSGKLTTATSLLEWINTKRSAHICTVEDPIMIRFTPKKSLIQQREVGVDIPDPATGVRAAFMQDADVLFVSEIKNIDVLQACLTMAENGHLVIIIMHASTPEDAVQRLIDVDARAASRKSLANVLRVVSAQRLLPRADKAGRVAAYGVIIPDDEMRGAIAEGRDFLTRTAPMLEGYRTVAEDIERLTREGIVDEQIAARYIAGN